MSFSTSANIVYIANTKLSGRIHNFKGVPGRLFIKNAKFHIQNLAKSTS